MIVTRTPSERVLARRRPAADAGSNIRPQRSQISPEQRAERLAQRPFVVWLTGLPSAGKTSLAFALEQRLFERGLTAHVLDGENLRFGLSSDLGFSGKDRWEHQRRAAEVAKLCCGLGLISVVALVSPLAADRAQARRIVGAERFFQVYCDAPLAVCERRDRDGLYARARAGEIDNVTGIDAPYDVPADADLTLDTATLSVADNVDRLLTALAAKDWL